MLGLLFDLDGTLALTNVLHEQAWRSVLAQYGVSLSPDGFARDISGRSNPDIVRRLLPHLSVEAGTQLASGKEEMFRTLATQLDTPKGLVELVEQNHRLGCKLAVVTNAPCANAAHVLSILGLGTEFSLVVGAEDVTAPKPDAEPYVLAAHRLGLAVTDCVAFEDSPSGVKAAVAARIPVAGVLTGHTAAELLTAGADIVVSDFSERALLSWVESARASRV
jgi:HAD superfamily hydrolase (TIGR01509 family)